MRSKFAKLAQVATLWLALVFTFSCSGNSDSNDGGGGGNESDKGNDIENYRTVEIGDQVWMAENLNYNVSGSRCYNDSIANCTKYGRLYDWATAKTVCPDGWHLSSFAEWFTLIDFIESHNECVDCAGRFLDNYGFSALSGCFYSYGLSLFSSVGNFGYWWTDTESPSSNAYEITYGDRYINFSSRGNKTNLLSVRCVKDNN